MNKLAACGVTWCYVALHKIMRYTGLHDNAQHYTYLLDGSSGVHRKVKRGGKKLLRLTTELMAILTGRERELNGEVWMG